jgi:hypothetical protein
MVAGGYSTGQLVFLIPDPNNFDEHIGEACVAD